MKKIPYMPTPEARSELPWLYEQPDQIARYNAIGLMDRLCRQEVRRISILPTARPRSPIERTRQEISTILDAVEVKGQIPIDVAIHVFKSSDRETIALLKNRVRAFRFTRTDWTDVIPEVTADALHEMFVQNLSTANFPMDKLGMLDHGTAVALASILATAEDGSQYLGFWIAQARKKQIPMDITSLFLRTLVSCAPEEASSDALESAHYLGDPANYIICHLAGSAYSPDSFENIENPRCRAILELTLSNHGRMRIRAAVPSFEAIIADITLLDRLY